MTATRPKHKTKWILCSKWFKKVPKPIVLTEEEKRGKEPPKKKLEYDYFPRWTPIGAPRLVKHRGKRVNLVYEYDSQAEAEQALKEIVNSKPKVSDFLFCTCEVRYVPSKIRVYEKPWFDKYVVKEVMLKIEKPKQGSETFEEQGSINPKGD